MNIIFKLKKTKIKKSILKEAGEREENTLQIEDMWLSEIHHSNVTRDGREELRLHSSKISVLHLRQYNVI